jgi:peroxiredoxin Q/BCP
MSAAGTFCASLGLVLVAAAAVKADSAGGLKPGDLAPAFSLPGSDGKTYKLADFKGRQAVVLAWFPKAFTSG